MAKICLYFQIHQPKRLKNMSIFDMGKGGNYFSEQNEEVMKKVATKSYRPMLLVLNRLLAEEPGFQYSVSISGVALEQMLFLCPDVVKMMADQTKTERVELLSETYYHSLASLYSEIEFRSQILNHKKVIRKYFDQSPTIFRNTELIYTNEIARTVKEMGFKGMLTEGAFRILRGRVPTRVYRSPNDLPLLLKHSMLSDDIAFRFSESARSNKPLTAETFSHWISSSFSDNDVVNLFMDFETFGEHQWSDTGIFDFFYYFVKRFLTIGGRFLTVSQALAEDKPVDVFDSSSPVSWADIDRDITAWRGNQLQRDSLNKIYKMEDRVLASHDVNLISDWRNLQTSDHFYYMCTKWSNDGDVHAYFSPYDSPYFAYVNYCHALADINLRLKRYG